MSIGFAELQVGDAIELKGPIGHFTWNRQGTVLLDGIKKRVQEMGMVCAGTGITPILQVVRGVLEDESENDTKLSVLSINRYVEDILCREELDQLAAQYPAQLRVHYSLTGNRVPCDWPYSTGRVSGEMLKNHLPQAGEGKMMCICGPPGMEQQIKGKHEPSLY